MLYDKVKVVELTQCFDDIDVTEHGPFEAITDSELFLLIEEIASSRIDQETLSSQGRSQCLTSPGTTPDDMPCLDLYVNGKILDQFITANAA